MKIQSNKQEYWEKRASEYSSFKWANDEGYLRTFIEKCELKNNDWVLDAGVGTGIVASAISSKVKRVIGIDNSKEMLAQCNGDFNMMFGDICDIPYPDKTFDKVIARNVLHHLSGGSVFLNLVIEGFYNILKKGGQIIIGERMPPSDEVIDEYENIFKLKDKRMVFLEDELIWHIENYGFKHISTTEFWIKGFNVDKWLDGLDLPRTKRVEIYRHHYRGSKELKKAYNMREKDGSLLIDIKNVIVVGEK